MRNKKYVVIPTADLTAEMWLCSLTRQGMARESLDGSLSLLKFDGPVPPGLECHGLAEIKVILNGPEWMTPESDQDA